MNKQRIFLVSDSTVQTFSEDWAPQAGWGQFLHCHMGHLQAIKPIPEAQYKEARYFETDQVQIFSWAIGGRSSRSFIEEGKWARLVPQIKAGDYVLIQWGHNDSTIERPNRYVEPSDFTYWLMKYYSDLKTIGAHPIFVTPVARFHHDDSGMFIEDFKAYGDSMRTLATMKSINLIDLSRLSIEHLNKIGPEMAKDYFMLSVEGKDDHTHLHIEGAYVFAGIVAQELKQIINDIGGNICLI
jgi:lysophospholipase L1-like esterase